MAEELAGKVAIVTGGAGGIGRATVELFVAEGARVVVADVATGPGKDLVATLGDAAAFLPTDVGDPDAVRQLVDFTLRRFGALDVMVNNAGISGAPSRGLIDDDLADFRRVIDVNLLGVMAGTQCAARHMAKGGGGSIVNTASIAALLPGAGFTTYRAAKAAVVHFTRCAAVDLAAHGIRVNTIAPGHIPTGMTTYDLSLIIELTQPLQRQGLPHDVANAALYLASERSALVTGLVLPVDGGTSVGAPPGPLRELMAARVKARGTGRARG